jgi:hypothetical protein
MDKRVVVASLVSGITGFVAGGAVAYFVTKKTFAERAQRDIDEVKASYAERFDGKKIVNVYGDMPGPAQPGDVVRTPVGNISTEEMRQAQEFVRNLGYATATPPKADEDPKGPPEDETISIYDRTPDEDPGEEVESPLLIGYDRNALRAAHKPYLISHEEFHNTETEWDKMSIMYYEEDDVLTDEADRPVDDIEYLIGEKHLEFFGLRSGGDKNQVFVRNPQISSDFEVTRHSGSYTEIVLGIPKDSDRVGIRRMRSGDGD